MGHKLGMLLAAVGVLEASSAQAQTAWPAEPWSSAMNLTSVEGAGTNDFYEDLSGAFWNPLTRQLWVCRNGPSNSTSKLWALRFDALGVASIDVQSDVRAEWTNFGDFEAVTQADLAEPIIYAMVETEEVIREYDVGVGGVRVLQRTWNTRPFLPLDGGEGAEGIAFVPDAHLHAAGFVDSTGFPRQSSRGMGGLMFVGHQNGGRVYVFDLERSGPTGTGAVGAFDFVGAYLTGAAETADLCFDRSTGDLLVLHGDGLNQIEAVSLASIPVGGGTERRFVTRASYLRPTGSPTNANIEGLALTDLADCVGGRRPLYLTIDDGGSISLLRFAQFPCACRPDFNHSGELSVQDLFDFLAAYFAGEPATDFNFSGVASVQDIFDFLASYFAGCGS